MRALLSEFERQVKKQIEEKGETIVKIADNFNVSRGTVEKAIKSLKEKGMWNEQKVKRARRNKRKRDYYEKHKEEPKRAKNETEAFKYLKDILAKKYLDYNPADPKTYEITISIQLSNLAKHYPDTVLLRAYTLAESSIEYACRTKTFDCKRNKALYIFAIIKNKIPQAVKEDKLRKLELVRLEKLNQPTEDIKDFDESKIEKRRDLSEFLEEDDEGIWEE